MRVRTVLLASALVASSIAPSMVAHADPPGGIPFELLCDELGAISVVTPPTEQDWTPALLDDGNRVLIPYAFEFSGRGYADGTEGPEEPDFVDTFSFAKPGPRNGRTDTCHFTVSFFLEDDALLVVDGTVLVSPTKR